jgi:hypothetical protein
MAGEIGQQPPKRRHAGRASWNLRCAVATLERLLRRLMHDPQLSLRIAIAARETARLRFSADRVVAQPDQIYAKPGLARSAGARTCMPARPLRGAA